MRTQRAISRKRIARHIGRTLEVLIDETDAENGAIGRSFADAPEIDGVVHISGSDKTILKEGNLCRVRIFESDDYDLFGVVDTG